METETERTARYGRRTAVIGSGVAGLTAAYLLGRAGHVTLYEADDRLGGHAHTHELTSPQDGRVHRVDAASSASSCTTGVRIPACCGSSTNSASPRRSRR